MSREKSRPQNWSSAGSRRFNARRKVLNLPCIWWTMVPWAEPLATEGYAKRFPTSRRNSPNVSLSRRGPGLYMTCEDADKSNRKQT